MVKRPKLRFSTFQDNRTRTGESCERPGNTHGSTPSVVNRGLVSNGTPAVGGLPSVITPKLPFSASRSFHESSTIRNTETSSDGIIRESFENQRLSPDIAEFLLESW